MLESDLDMSQYLQRFEALLFFEEVQMEVDIRMYDMENVALRLYHANKRLLLLEVCVSRTTLDCNNLDSCITRYGNVCGTKLKVQKCVQFD